MIKKLAVFCGARPGCHQEYIDMAAAFGDTMAEHHIDLVYGGGRFGLMGTVANHVLDHGGQAFGVITKELKSRDTSLNRLTDLKVTDNMDLRKEAMMEMADGLVALPGGLGTAEEVIQAASWTGVGDNNKPVAFFNYHHFYDNMYQQLVVMKEEGFLEPEYLDAVCFTDSFDEMIEFMNRYQAPHYRQYH
ncbi:TIGR00730 family Rossman fold protein [uncultured Limosilactobacillus sp.]|uniref:LOG family protein n=1 Tax=uncultured Limosilactobacillus sp. TaxID=2837629 RepID=UPI0025DB6E32|nr:TIGR00730 family Rossman fold protein [uncultured Limosilactobacillus sp.]